MLDSKRLREILEGIRRTRVGVIGDFCLDVYWTIDMSASEISLETGKPTHPVRKQRYSLGGAGNVAANLAALGVERIYPFAVVGEDPFGHAMERLLAALPTAPDCVIRTADPSWQTLTYCKPYVGEEELSRLDMGNFNCLPDAIVQKLLDRLERALPEIDVVIVNQQVTSGVHTPTMRRRLRELMQRAANTVFIYDGRHYTDCYPESWLKVNAHEALRLCGTERAPDEIVMRDEAVAAARMLFERTGRPVFVTRGERGAVVCTADGINLVPGIEILGPVDPVGAGDSFLAATAASVAGGAAPEEAAEIGNFAAAVTVQKLQQTGTASPEELLEVGVRPRYIYEPELAEDPRRARNVEGTAIEIVTALPKKPEYKFALFDHDGTISVLRQGWEEVMEDVMVRAILGDRFESADETLYHRVVERVRTYIDKTTGIQTLVQMQGLVAMVREFGIVPEEEILDEFGYKKIYNDALMQRVNRRIERLRRGELDLNDLTIKGAVAWLERLHAAGVVLFLASGTDTEDVVAEAEALGYAHLFEGRIYGAVGDVRREAKREVLERILAEIGDVRGRLVTFGDGPVEIRETRRCGGLAIGVASDEVRRFDLNPSKRSRLIRAGADLVIPDFTQHAALARVLGVE